MILYNPSIIFPVIDVDPSNHLLIAPAMATQPIFCLEVENYISEGRSYRVRVFQRSLVFIGAPPHDLFVDRQKGLSRVHS